MKLSIIIPTYKGTESLKIAIESILIQNKDDIEIIVSDDNVLGSKEQIETEKIVNNYNNIIYLKNGHHNGSYARNRGIEIAKGDFISLLDDDDFYLDDYIDNVLHFFCTNLDTDILLFDVISLTAEKTTKYISCPNISPKNILYGKSEIGTGSNICFRRNVASTNLFDEKYTRHQDIEFITKAMNAYKYKWIEKPMIVKYHNSVDNYPKVEKALEMQLLLRSDMLYHNIIDKVDIENIKNIQLHGLYNDLLAKNAPLNDIKMVKNELKINNLLSFVDNSLFLIYSTSKSLFNLLFSTFIKLKFRKRNNISSNFVISYRDKLIERDEQ